MSGPVLGVNFGTHDAAAALVVDGRIVAAAEEERFNRVKHSKSFPAGAADYCLRTAGLAASDVHRIALFVDPKRQLLLPISNLAHGGSLRAIASGLAKYALRRSAFGHLRQHFESEITPVVHHQAHAASAYLTSPFDQATIVTIDGRGEYETACVFEGRGGALIRKHAVHYPHSIGYLYSMITRFLGFRPQTDEFKVMGLSAYGSPALVSEVSSLAHFDEATGRPVLNLDYFDHHRRPSTQRELYSPKLITLLGPARRADEPLTDRHRDIAYAAQRLTEQLVLRYVLFAKQIVPSRGICLAGGVAFNSVANAVILESGLFDDVVIQPAAGDAGTSLGAAMLVAGARTDRPDAFLGPSFDDAAICAALRGLPARRVVSPAREAARLLRDGRVIGWFQGRMEFGPRALGSRSILAPAIDISTVHRINSMIKGRELFRPLAPAVLAENAPEYFDLTNVGRHVYPFMLATARARSERKALIPAVVHVDDSARLQTVDRDTNPLFWEVIAEYARMTGIPVVLNTSFNGADEPIVRTPQDAVRSFLTCSLDALVIGDWIVEPLNCQSRPVRSPGGGHTPRSL